jgi:trans-aconitate 2-methyltransferase
MADWDAEAYARISEPQFAWGKRVLERLALRGDEVVEDAGCGAGRLTELLVERLHRGRVVAVDASEAMLRQARAHLARFGDRVTYVQANLATHVQTPPVDAVFTTATLHWVLDHDGLFHSLAASLRSGGSLVAQFGGAGNLARVGQRTSRLRADPRFASHFAGWRSPWIFAGVEETTARLAALGFVDVRAWLEPAPARFEGSGAFGEFVAKVVLRDELARLPEGEPRKAYVAAVVDAASADDPPFELDYVRLNVDARRA